MPFPKESAKIILNNKIGAISPKDDCLIKIRSADAYLKKVGKAELRRKVKRTPIRIGVMELNYERA